MWKSSGNQKTLLQGIWTNLPADSKTNAFSVSSWNPTKLLLGILIIFVLSSCWLRGWEFFFKKNLFRIVLLALTDPLPSMGLGSCWTPSLMCLVSAGYDEIPWSPLHASCPPLPLPPKSPWLAFSLVSLKLFCAYTSPELLLKCRFWLSRSEA